MRYGDGIGRWGMGYGDRIWGIGMGMEIGPGMGMGWGWDKEMR